MKTATVQIDSQTEIPELRFRSLEESYLELKIYYALRLIAGYCAGTNFIPAPGNWCRSEAVEVKNKIKFQTNH